MTVLIMSGEDLDEVMQQVGNDSLPHKRPPIPDTMPTALAEFMQGISLLWMTLLKTGKTRALKSCNGFDGLYIDGKNN